MKNLKNSFNLKANIAYIVAGYPSLKHTKDFLTNLDNSKIDILEIGIPYSDPISDGSTIEKAALKAIKNGVNTDTVFTLLQKIKVKKPLVFLVYYNIIFSYGVDKFIKQAKKSRIKGFIVPDLPFEESKELSKKLKQNNISLIQLVSLTSKNRVSKIVKNAEGFIYAVGVMGITGGKKASLKELEKLVQTIKTYTKTPVAIGFGIKTKDDIKQIKNICDGAIVGTKVIQICEKYPNNSIKKIDQLFT